MAALAGPKLTQVTADAVWIEDATSGGEDDRAYVGVRCLACSGITW